jgi:hypothetical protein
MLRNLKAIKLTGGLMNQVDWRIIEALKRFNVEMWVAMQNAHHDCNTEYNRMIYFNRNLSE